MKAVVATGAADHPFRRTRYLDELIEGEAETFDCQVRARDGREFWIVGNVVSTARESTGRQLTYALLDIERRREAEARMSQAQAQLQRIIEAAPLAITLRDAGRSSSMERSGCATVFSTIGSLVFMVSLRRHYPVQVQGVALPASASQPCGSPV